VDLGRSRTPALTLVALAVFAAPAGAATVSVDDSTLRVLAAPGELNQLTVRGASVKDTGAPLVAAAGCAPSPGGATCAASDGAFVGAGDGDDAVDVRNGTSDSVWCGRGRDSVAADVLDFLDLRCERVDYGPAGSVGRVKRRSGGGGLVEIPGQTWARVDRRVLPDVLYLVRRYHVRIDEGYGTIRSASTRLGWLSTSSRARVAAGPPWGGSPAGRSRARTTRARRSGGLAGTATSTTETRRSAGRDSAVRRTCTSRGRTRPPRRVTSHARSAPFV
jgi:hypothetical protein